MKDKNEMKNEKWRIYLLKIDKGSEEIAKFFENKLDFIVYNLKKEAENLRYVEKNKIKEIITKEIIRENKENKENEKIIAICGSGAWHHFTYGFCSGIKDEFVYVHFDRHCDSDYEKYYNNSNSKKVCKIDCDSFVSEIQKDITKKILYVYAARKGIQSINRHELWKALDGNKLEDLVKEKFENFENLYLSLDLDVMAKDEIATDYSRGDIRKNELLPFLKEIKRQKNIVGADIFGYAQDGIREKELKEKSLQLYYDIAKIIINY